MFQAEVSDPDSHLDKSQSPKRCLSFTDWRSVRQGSGSPGADRHVVMCARSLSFERNRCNVWTQETVHQ
jgi:hypothetical protein